MLAKRTSAAVSCVSNPLVGKVVGPRDLANETHNVERCFLDLRQLANAVISDELISLPWLGFITADPRRVEGRCTISALSDDTVIAEGDVIRIAPKARYVDVLYRRSANANALFVTERCTNFCVMCSQPPREVNDRWRITELTQVIDLIDRTEQWLGITGGEPTLLGEDLYHLIRACGSKLPTTALHVLTNGRRFAEHPYANQAQNVHHDVTWGIPLYGDVAHLHDYVVQHEGAFAETIRGLYQLARIGQKIEIRVVLVKDTLARLSKLASYIRWNFPFVTHVALMGLEPQGFARANYEAIWQDPADFASKLEDSVSILHNRGIRTSIYNLPLCVLPVSLWRFARRSISDWKNTYLDACAHCRVRDECCGFFSSATKHWISRAITPISDLREVSP